MRQFVRKTALFSLIVVLGMTTACGNTNQVKKAAQPPATSQPRIQAQSVDDADAVIALKTIGTASYVSVNDLAEVLQYQTRWSTPRQTLLIGDIDANYEIQMNSTHAMKSGEAIEVKQPFVLQGDTAYVPVSALGDLFQEDMSYDIQDGQLHIHPSLKGSSSMTIQEVDSSDSSGQPDLNFADDPTDPAQADIQTMLQMDSGKSEKSISVLKQVNMNAIIRRARQYLGVPYQFGADPYPQSGRFDCSTFTRYIYGRSGVQLPRLARQQANTGILISRKNLRVGDLLFFYVPGRFKTNHTVGHVGIYLGNKRMIHSCPLPKNGVQITTMDNNYWRSTFVRARRVAY